ncbi:MAG: class II histone deacetylase, partial [Pseudomonadota bacterium]
QPMVAGGLPEGPEAKRRFKNLMDASGLSSELVLAGAPTANEDELLSVHPLEYLAAFKDLSDRGGGELGLRAPFGPGSFEIAAQSAGLVLGAVSAVALGQLDNAYALARPPGHHCLPDRPNGFCLLNNIAIAVEAGLASNAFERVAILDWDVHHGNGTEAIFYDRPDVLTISLHQERNYPLNTGGFEDRGAGKGEGYNLNIPLLPGGGHSTYFLAMESLVLPHLRAFKPDLIVVACGFDASGVDPLSRMLAGSDTFRSMTAMTMAAASDLCDGKLVLAHEGGYSELHVPFCGHAVMEELSGSEITVDDPLAARIEGQQPSPEFAAFLEAHVLSMRDALDPR